MTKLESVSVVMPIHNAVPSLEKSILSLINQTHDDLEIVLVNDGSTDNSLEIIKRLSESSNNVVCLDLPENVGTYEARRLGIEAASASWIGFLDSDDYALPDMYRAMQNVGSDKSVDIVVCGSKKVNSNRKKLANKVRFSDEALITEDVFGKFCSLEFGTGTLWNKLFRSDVIKPLTRNKPQWRLKFNEDMLLSIGCFLNASSVYLMKEVLHEYFLSEQSVTLNCENRDSFINAYRAYALALMFYASADGTVARSICMLYQRQLGFSVNQVNSVEELLEYEESLQEVVELISRVYPLGHAFIASRPPQPFLLRHALRELISDPIGVSRRLLRSLR